MKIVCEVRDIIEQKPEDLTPGRYLFIDKDGSSINIPFSEFQGFYEESERNLEPVKSDPEFGVDENIKTVIPEKSSMPDYKRVLAYLIERISITSGDFGEDKDELIIESSFGNFLELPWEDIAQGKIFVLRRVVGEKKNNYENTFNNFLFVVSNSHITANGEVADLKEKLREEVLAIVHQAMDVIPKEFKVGDMHIAKHTTKSSFSSLPWDKYNYIHIIMHGDDKGGLCLETEGVDNYKVQDIIGIDDVASMLTDKKFFLLFFSICHSGGGVDGNNSLAFHIANNGISKYAIGYRLSVGEDSASTFAQIFYKILLSGQHAVEEVYKKSLAEYYSKPISNNGYMPLLYINA